MQCFVLMRNINPNGTTSAKIQHDDCEWATQGPTGISGRLIANMGSSTIKDSIVKTLRGLEANLDRFHYVKLQAFHVYGQVFESDCYLPDTDTTVIVKRFFALSTDTPLKPKQLVWLRKYILEYWLPLQTIVDNPADYTVYHEALVLQRQIQETTGIMRNNLVKMDIRGDNLDRLLGKTEDLVTAAEIFQHQTQELNSCWPQFCLGWFTLPELPTLPALPTLPWPFG